MSFAFTSSKLYSFLMSGFRFSARRICLRYSRFLKLIFLFLSPGRTAARAVSIMRRKRKLVNRSPGTICTKRYRKEA